MKICWDNLEKLRYNKNTEKWYTKSNVVYSYAEKCLNCKESFLVSQSILNKVKNKKVGQLAGKFCSYECKKKYVISERHHNYKGGLKIITCPICGKKFKRTRKEIKYCSIKCGNKSLEKQKATLVCNDCNKEYKLTPSQYYLHKKRSQKYNFCSKKCMSNFFKGENSPNWIKDRSKLKNPKHSIRWSKLMNDWRKSVYLRDNYTCALCGNRSSKNNSVVLNAHHIRTFKKYPELRFEISNGVTLCEKCHKKTYKKEEYFEEFFDNHINHKQVHKLPGCGYHELRCVNGD